MPGDPSGYDCHMLDGLKVYVARELAALEVNIDIDCLGPWSRLYAEAPILSARPAESEGSDA